LDLTAKATKAKINKWATSNSKASILKEAHQQNEKTTYQMRENICKPYKTFNTKLISKIYEEFI